MAPPHPWEQDWEWSHNDPERIGEYLRLYRDETTPDDEREVLLEMLVQSVADLGQEEQRLPEAWDAVAVLLRKRPDLHTDTIAYWAGFEPPHAWALVGGAVRGMLDS